MSDLKLVPPDQPTPFEQRLLDAVANESPSAEQRARVRLALGLPAVAPPMVSSASVARRASLLKAGAGLIVVSGAMLALFLALGPQPGSAEKPPAASATQQVPAVAATVAAADPVSVPSAAAPASEPAPSAASLNRDSRDDSVPSKRAGKVAPADNGADLSEQLRLIDAARAAVAAGNAAAAATALNSYRTRFPRGPFGQEAAVLQIETLDLQGNHAQAATQARSFLARYPNSPHVSVVRRIAGR
jgi:TolA-binding protein